jgi:predicted dehydrogenase
LIDQALHLFGLPETVNASFAVLRKGGETDDWAHIQLNYKTLRVILHTSLLVSGGVPRSMLHGTLGSWVKFGADVQEKQLASGVRPCSPGFGDDPDPGIFYEGVTGKQTKIPAPAANQAEYYVGIREALWDRQPNPVPAEQASAVMSILDTSFQSGAKGRVLQLDLTDKERAAFAASPY